MKIPCNRVVSIIGSTGQLKHIFRLQKNQRVKSVKGTFDGIDCYFYVVKIKDGTTVYLRDTPIEMLPGSLRNLKLLRRLDLKQLPDWFDKLISLESLDLRKNNNLQLSVKITQLRRL